MFLPSIAVLLALSVLAGCTSRAPEVHPAPTVSTVEPLRAARRPPAFLDVLYQHGMARGIPRSGKAILVNIPSFELIAFEDGEPVLRSRVIVGKDIEGDRTPRLDTRTSVVRFRPTWRPTPAMIRSGKYVDGIRPAGPTNPLGLLAVRLEPGSVIYLHGTNKPELFEREDRALSAGCVRVERWARLAAWILDKDIAAVHAAANGRRTFDAPTSGVPVMFRYHTRFPDNVGTLKQYRDVYGLSGEGIDAGS